MDDTTQRLSRRGFLRRAAVLGLGASAASLLAACGGSSAPAAAPTTAPAAAAPTTAPAAAAPTSAPAASAPTSAAAVPTTAAASAATSAPAAAAATTGPATAKTLTGPVNALVFGGYDIAELAKGFQEKHGVAVNYTPFNANEEAFNKLKAGGLADYDVVQADSFYFQRYWQEGMIDLLDYSEFESSKDLLPQFSDIEIWRQDGKHLAWPSMWAPYPVIYNPDEVKPVPDSWGVLWDQKYAGKVGMLDRPVEPIVVTAYLLGFKDPFALTPDELKQCEAKLLEQKPLIRSYWQDAEGLTNKFASGEYYVTLSFGPGLTSAVREKGKQAESMIPKEGTIGWIDGSALIKGAKNRDAAIKWMDFHYSAEGYQVIAKTAPFGVPNKRAIDMLKAAGKDDFIHSTLSDKPEVAATMHHYRPPKDIDAYQQTWNRILAA